MSASGIEQLIDEIEDYIDGCKPSAFSGNKKIVVDKDEIDELLLELRQRTPEEIKRYQKIISNEDAILEDANHKAQDMIAEATRNSQLMVAEAEKKSEDMISEATSKTQELLNEHEIIQEAYARADKIIRSANVQGQQIVDQAVSNANNIRESAIRYTDDMLESLQDIIAHTMDGARGHFEALNSALENSYQIVSSNRRELAGEEPDQPYKEDNQEEH